MIFPHDVNKYVSEQRRVAGENRTQLIIVLFVVGNFAAFLLLHYVVVGLLMLSGTVATVIQVVLLLIVGTIVFRFGIFDENEKRRESEGADSDTFARFMDIRKDNVDTFSVGKQQIHAFEYSNGNVVAIMEFKFGANDAARSKATTILYQSVFHSILSYGFIARLIDSTENFRTSDELARHRARLNKISDPELRKNNFVITNAILDAGEKLCNVDIIYVMIQSRSLNQKDDLEPLVRELNRILENNATAFRHVRYLDTAGMLEFFRDFYKIDAIDLSMMKTIALSQDLNEDFANVVSVYSVAGRSGRVYRTKRSQDVDKIKIEERKI